MTNVAGAPDKVTVTTLEFCRPDWWLQAYDRIMAAGAWQRYYSDTDSPERGSEACDGYLRWVCQWCAVKLDRIRRRSVPSLFKPQIPTDQLAPPRGTRPVQKCDVKFLAERTAVGQGDRVTLRI